MVWYGAALIVLSETQSLINIGVLERFIIMLDSDVFRTQHPGALGCKIYLQSRFWPPF